MMKVWCGQIDRLQPFLTFVKPIKTSVDGVGAS
jgi:hypothetical protein